MYLKLPLTSTIKNTLSAFIRHAILFSSSVKTGKNVNTKIQNIDTIRYFVARTFILTNALTQINQNDQPTLHCNKNTNLFIQQIFPASALDHINMLIHV